jgi:hypothetical protein
VELQPEELLLAALVRRAIKDAQAGNERVREDSLRWLWWVAPGIAQCVRLPRVVEVPHRTTATHLDHDFSSFDA